MAGVKPRTFTRKRKAAPSHNRIVERLHRARACDELLGLTATRSHGLTSYCDQIDAGVALVVSASPVVRVYRMTSPPFDPQSLFSYSPTCAISSVRLSNPHTRRDTGKEPETPNVNEPDTVMMLGKDWGVRVAR